jgi:hypothetical protein
MGVKRGGNRRRIRGDIEVKWGGNRGKIGE